MQGQRRVHLALGGANPRDVAQNDRLFAPLRQQSIGGLEVFQGLVWPTLLNQSACMSDQRRRVVHAASRVTVAETLESSFKQNARFLDLSHLRQSLCRRAQQIQGGCHAGLIEDFHHLCRPGGGELVFKLVIEKLQRICGAGGEHAGLAG